MEAKKPLHRQNSSLNLLSTSARPAHALLIPSSLAFLYKTRLRSWQGLIKLSFDDSNRSSDFPFPDFCPSLDFWVHSRLLGLAKLLLAGIAATIIFHIGGTVGTVYNRWEIENSENHISAKQDCENMFTKVY